MDGRRGCSDSNYLTGRHIVSRLLSGGFYSNSFLIKSAEESPLGEL